MDYSRFHNIYNSLPEMVRKEVVVVLNDEAYSWEAVNVEIANDTDLGKQMFEKMIEIGVI